MNGMQIWNEFKRQLPELAKLVKKFKSSKEKNSIVIFPENHRPLLFTITGDNTWILKSLN